MFAIQYAFSDFCFVLDRLISSGTFNNKLLAIYGTQAPSLMIKEYLEKFGYKVSFVLDHSIRSDYACFEGIEILPPEKLLSSFMEDLIVLIGFPHGREIVTRLGKMGYTENINVFEIVNKEELSLMVRRSVANYKLLTVRETQKEQLQILKYVKNVCAEHDLRYFLCAGTLLGAIRHQGFIPWDDDIDISMPYPDYCKLIEIIQCGGDYLVVNADTCKGFERMFTQIYNPKIFARKIWFPILSETRLYIDVFPIFSIPDDERQEREILRLNRQLKDSLKLDFVRGFEMGNDVFHRNRQKLMDMWKTVGFFESEKVLRTCLGASGYFEEEIVPYAAYGETIDMVFEDSVFKVPIGYDEILSELFGNYMEMPPVEKQSSHHPYIYYRKDQLP